MTQHGGDTGEGAGLEKGGMQQGMPEGKNTHLGLVSLGVGPQVVVGARTLFDLLHHKLLCQLIKPLGKEEEVVLPDHCLHIGLVHACARLGHAPELRAVVLHEDKLGAAALLTAGRVRSRRLEGDT